jgi:hypothetical protein
MAALIFAVSLVAQAGSREAKIAFDKGDFDTAFKEVMPIAEQSNASAQYTLGEMYDRGQGVAQDYQKAVLWYRKAAAQGYAKAQCNLGLKYEKGQGVAQDYAQAAAWYRKGADQGHVPSHYNLGLLYAKGLGMPKDLVRAYVGFFLANVNGYREAEQNMKVAQAQMTPQQLEQAQALAKAWLIKHQRNRVSPPKTHRPSD